MNHGHNSSLQNKWQHTDETFITSSKSSNNTFRCSQWWQFHQYDNISVSMLVLYCIHIRHCVKICWLFLDQGEILACYLLISNMVIHRSFTRPSHLLSANVMVTGTCQPHVAELIIWPLQWCKPKYIAITLCVTSLTRIAHNRLEWCLSRPSC